MKLNEYFKKSFLMNRVSMTIYINLASAYPYAAPDRPYKGISITCNNIKIPKNNTDRIPIVFVF